MGNDSLPGKCLVLTRLKMLVTNPFSRSRILHNKVVECESLVGKRLPGKNLVNSPKMHTHILLNVSLSKNFLLTHINTKTF